MNRANKIIVFIGCLLVLLALQRLSIVDNTNKENIIANDSETKIEILKEPHLSGYYTSENPLFINASATGVDAQNWTWAIDQGWCFGSGTEEDPFLIENISITVSDADNAGLRIINNGSYFTLSNVTIINDAGNGLLLEDTTNGDIVSCNFSLNGITGINLDNVNDTIIESTYCLNNTQDGIYAVDSNLNEFIVECSGNGRNGLMLASCDNNTVTISQFFDNIEVGVAIIELEEHSTSINNVVYTNDFADNGINAVDNSTVANSWDHSETGNTWDDYTGVDADDDLVGDTPYDIDGTAGAQDNYPYCNDGPETVSTSTSDDDDEEEEPKPLEPVTLVIIGGIFFGTFVGLIYLTKFLTPKR